MKKLFLSALVALFVSFAVEASASAVTTAVQNAINSGNYAGIEAIAAANPGAQGEIAMYLLQQAQSKVNSNPAQAAKIFAAAGPYVAQIPAEQSQNAATIIAGLVKTVSGAGFETANPCPCADILSAALGMTSQPNVSSANSDLHAQTLASADGLLKKNPQCASTKELEQNVSLAQTPGTPPTVNAIGAHVPSVE